MRALTVFASFIIFAAILPAQQPAPAPPATPVNLGNVELSQVQTIYIMPMASGFDQYLANQIRTIPNFRIVTDPAKADAFFTDRLGAAFESKLDDYESAAIAKEKEKELLAAGELGKEPQGLSQQGFKFAPKMVTNLGRGRGNYFIVDKRTRVVLWSTYMRAKDPLPKTLDRTAQTVVSTLKKDLTGKK